MAFIHPDASECLLDSLDLFTVPNTQTTVEGSYYSRFYPLTSLERGPIEFKIQTSDTVYIDPSDIYFYTKTRILKEDGTPVVGVDRQGAPIADNIVFPVNYFHQTRFKTLETFLNNRLVSEVDNLYHYRSYIEFLLSYSKQPKEQLGEMVMYYPNGEHQDQPTAVDNPSCDKRLERTLSSKPFEMLGKIHSDILGQDRLLPGNTQLRLRFHRADPEFALMAATAGNRYKISIDSAVLLVRCVNVSAALRQAHAEASLKSPYKYPASRVKMLFFTHGAGRQDFSVHNAVIGTLPKRVTVGFVKSSSFHGSLASSPFEFQHFSLKHLSLRVNGQTLPLENGIDVDFSNDLHLLGYWSLLQGTNKLFTDENIGFKPFKEYPNGNCLFSFDISAEMRSQCTDHFDLVKEGALDIIARTKDIVGMSITMVCHLEYDHIFELSGQGDIQ